MELVPGENPYSRSVGINLLFMLLQFFFFLIKVKLPSIFFFYGREQTGGMCGRFKALPALVPSESIPIVAVENKRTAVVVGGKGLCQPGFPACLSISTAQKLNGEI